MSVIFLIWLTFLNFRIYIPEKPFKLEPLKEVKHEVVVRDSASALRGVRTS